ncbi:MAG: EI24 domain-containing protein [Flavobacteriales bacterium]
MKRMEEIKYAMSFWSKAWRFIQQHKLNYFFLFPIIISIAVYGFAFYGINELTQYSHDNIKLWLESKQWISQDQQDVFSKTILVAIKILTWVAGLLVFFKVSKYITLTLMSPVMSYLSSKTDEIITEKNQRFDIVELIKDFVRGTALSIRNFLVEMSLHIGLFFVNLIFVFTFPPLEIVLTPLSTVASFVISAYFFGFASIDYTLENRKYSFNQSIAYMRQHKGKVIGNGIGFSLLFMIPVIGVTIATILSTVAGTLMVNDLSSQEKK